MVALFAQQSNIWSNPVQVQRGDIWQLGKHRLCCGDATNAEDVAQLFGDEQFSLCFTSPPYSDQRTYKLGSFDWHSLMCGTFDQIIAHGKSDCHILINLGLSHKNRQVDMYWLGWLMHCAEMEWPLFGWYVWDKGSGMPGDNRGRLMDCHEWVFHFNKKRNLANKWIATVSKPPNKPHTHYRQKDGTLKLPNSPDKMWQPFKTPDSVIRLNREYARGEHTQNHPAVFPVALPEFMMQTWSQPHDIVYEPFNGSGTSIIAGENLNRRVFAMEIEPTYCQLAIQRWQEMTGQKAEVNNG